MRIVLALVACTGCVYTSVDTDGRWSSLEEPCVPLGPTHKLLDSTFSVLSVPAGKTLLYSSGSTISQLDSSSGDSKVVLRSDGISEFGFVGDELVYYEANGNPQERAPIDVIIDHGAHSTSRYERISPRRGHYNAGLITTHNGIYWWSSANGDLEFASEWRWDPVTSSVTPFEMHNKSTVVSDDESFFYFDTDSRLVVRSQTTGEVTVVAELDPEAETTPQPIGIDGDEVFYFYSTSFELDGDLIARKFDGTERVLASGRQFVYGAIDSNYVYFSDGSQDANWHGTIWRVPRAGGDVQTFFEAGDFVDVFDIRTDACNVYWQIHTFDSGALYASEITP